MQKKRLGRSVLGGFNSETLNDFGKESERRWYTYCRKEYIMHLLTEKIGLKNLSWIICCHGRI